MKHSSYLYLCWLRVCVSNICSHLTYKDLLSTVYTFIKLFFFNQAIFLYKTIRSSPCINLSGFTQPWLPRAKEYLGSCFENKPTFICLIKWLDFNWLGNKDVPTRFYIMPSLLLEWLWCLGGHGLPFFEPGQSLGTARKINYVGGHIRHISV